MRHYLVLIGLLTGGLLGLFFFGNESVLSGLLHPDFPWLLLFYLGQSFIVHLILKKAEKEDWKSPIYTLAAITFRFLSALFALAILFLMHVPDLKALMIQFVGLYLLYLTFELFAILPNLRRN